MKIKNLIFDNIAIKLLSFIFAVILWFYVASKGRIETDLVVPLELRNVPTYMVIADKVIDHVDIRLSGRGSLIERLDQNQIKAHLDLSKAIPGENTFKLGPGNFNLPSTVEVLRIEPRVLKITLEPINPPGPEVGSQKRNK